MNEQLLTIQDAASRLGCSPRTLRRRIELKALPVFRDGRIIRIRESDLHTYIHHHTNNIPNTAAKPHPHTIPRRPQPTVRNLFDLPDPLVDPTSRIDLSSDKTHKCPGGAGTPRGRQQGGTP